MCYCDKSDREILEDIQNITIPSDALLRDCCWSRICQVRGRYFNLVDSEEWQEICTKRGYLFKRQNPRGY
jgi:hypothetical protein